MALHGKDGNIQVGGSDLVNIQNWSLSLIGETGETTSMGDTFGQHLVGLTDFNATAEGKIAEGLNTVTLLGTSGVDATFIQDAGVGQYEGGAIVTGFTETAVIDDVISISYTIEGDDATGPVFSAAGDAGAGAEKTIHGKAISAEFGVTPTAFIDVRGWTVTGSVPVSDASVAHATLHGRQKLAGVKALTATVTILTPATDLPVREGDAPFLLNLARTATITDGEYQGTAIFTGSEAGVDVTGTEITQLSFLYTGTVVLAVSV